MNTTGGIETVLESHLWHHRHDRRCVCGWNADPYTAGDPVEQYVDHVAAAVRAHLLSDAVVERAAEVIDHCRGGHMGVDSWRPCVRAALAAAVGGDTE